MRTTLSLNLPAARRLLALLAIITTCCWSIAGHARPADCFTTDEGNYACDFRATGEDGSFEISAPGKPTYILNVEEPGVAVGFLGIGGRNTALPGQYKRRGESACWVNTITRAEICAR